jgi:hypothetical protein
MIVEVMAVLLGASVDAAASGEPRAGSLRGTGWLVKSGAEFVAFGASGRLARRVILLALAAPLFLAFEVWQLVVSERYLGIKQIARGADPRALGLRELTAFFWSTTLILYWVWMVLLLVLPFGRAQAAGLMLVTAIGFALRRGAQLKWVLVILTFEGALRVGFLISLTAMAWRRL